METQRLTINLPAFCGFYETMWCGPDDAASAIESEASARGVSEDELGFDWKAYQAAVAKALVAVEREECNRLFPSLNMGSEFKIWSPREYNFSSDEIEVEIDFSEVTGRALAGFLAQYIDILGKVIAREFAPRPGFIPYLPNKVSTWIEYLTDGKEHNRIEAMISAVLNYALRINNTLNCPNAWREPDTGIISSNGYEYHIYSDVFEKVDATEFVTDAK